MTPIVAITWALWISGNSNATNNHHTQPYVAAYVTTEKDCKELQKLLLTTIAQDAKTACLSSTYLIK